ncbi:MAG: helix-turn-helix domain-containing protein [Treponema sp.]|nr:helix-turn-helix domain-containing protein [Treponema sp.]
MKPNLGTPDILSRREAAAFLGICLTTLDRLDIPRTRVRHRVMFKRDVLNKWIDDHTENTKRGKI